ncbi:MAG: hypothetical protein K8R25_03480 [Methanosarcinales archaeon]|jgi:hypothetical protein|nr:hypothetical protein [Methanosarcinales archaeon]
MIKMEEPVKLAIVTAVLMMAVTIFFKNIVHESQDVVSLSSIPLYLYVGYLMGKFGDAKVWMGTMLFITLAMAVFYAFF